MTYAPIVSTSSSPFAQFSETLDLAALARSARYRPAPRTASEQGSEFYRVETSAGRMSYPRVSSALDGIGKPWMARWIIKTEHEGFRAAAREQLLSTQLGDGPLIARAEAVARMEHLSPVMMSEKLKGQAAAFGTRLHALIEAFLKAGTVPSPSASRSGLPETELLVAFTHWLAWWRASGFTVVRTEQKVSCPSCGYGGTLDALARDPEGRLWLLDWKSSKRISAEYGLQASAYAHASPDPVHGAIVVRIPHTPRAKIQERRFTTAELAEHFAVFGHALSLWRWQRRAAGQDAGDAPLGH